MGCCGTPFFVFLVASLDYFSFMFRTKEKPHQISISTGFIQDNASGELAISNIFFAGEEPDTFDKRQTLVIPFLSTMERNAVLGEYLSQWDLIENQIQFLLSGVVTGDTHKISEIQPIRMLGLNLNMTRDLVLNYADGTIKQDGVRAIKEYFKGLANLNGVRNRIVHAVWRAELRVGSDTNGYPTVQSHEWVRMAPEKNVSQKRKLEENDPTTLKMLRRTLSDIEEDTRELSEFIKTHEDLCELALGEVTET